MTDARSGSPDDRYAGRRVLVTGGSGFIGSTLLRALGARGAELHAVSRGTPSEPDALGTRWWQVDLAAATSASCARRCRATS